MKQVKKNACGKLGYYLVIVNQEKFENDLHMVTGKFVNELRKELESEFGISRQASYNFMRSVYDENLIPEKVVEYLNRKYNLVIETTDSHYKAPKSKPFINSNKTVGDYNGIPPYEKFLSVDKDKFIMICKERLGKFPSEIIEETGLANRLVFHEGNKLPRVVIYHMKLVYNINYSDYSA